MTAEIENVLGNVVKHCIICNTYVEAIQSYFQSWQRIWHEQNNQDQSQVEKLHKQSKSRKHQSQKFQVCLNVAADHES